MDKVDVFRVLGDLFVDKSVDTVDMGGFQKWKQN